MKQIQAWIERVLVPIVNKITSNFWFGIVADAILYIVPFSMVKRHPLHLDHHPEFRPGPAGHQRHQHLFLRSHRPVCGLYHPLQLPEQD